MNLLHESVDLIFKCREITRITSGLKGTAHQRMVLYRLTFMSPSLAVARVGYNAKKTYNRPLLDLQNTVRVDHDQDLVIPTKQCKCKWHNSSYTL